MIGSYKDAVEFLFNQLPVFERVGASAYKPGLERVTALSREFGDPHRHLKKVIHIAGTNGKGSTAHTLAAILQSAGYRTGLFTSPHLLDFRERIRVNGEMITQEAVVDFVNRYVGLSCDLSPSFFELTTVLAFEWFVRSDVDIAIVEVGLGGRLDSTNIVSPDLCVITNISLDHTSLLGGTPEAIASEKAGIIKPSVPVVIGEAFGAVREVFEDTAHQCGSPVYFAQDCNPVSSFEPVVGGILYQTISDGDFIGELAGDYQVNNTTTILSAVARLRDLGVSVPVDAVQAGFGNVSKLTGLQGRWMKLSDSPLVVCDTGHNPGGWIYLVKQINDLTGCKHIVIGFVADKDVSAILKMMADNIHDARYYFTAPQCPRRLGEERLRELALSHGLEGECFRNVQDAYEKALADCGKGDVVFIGGSNYVAAELLSIL